MTLRQLEERTPFGAKVTWVELGELFTEAQKVFVTFYAHTNNPEEPTLGRAIEITKECAILRAQDGMRWHPKNDERVYVFAAAGSLYFGSK